MSEVAEKTAEVVAENVEEAIDGVVDVVEVARHNIPLLVGAFVAGVAGGTGLGYFLAVKKLGKEFDARLEEEIADAKAFYATFNKVDVDGAVLTPQEVMEQRHGAAAAAEALNVYQGNPETPAETEEELIAEAKEEQGHPSDEAMDEAQIRKIEEARVHSVSIDKEVGPGGGEITEVVEKTETRNVFVDPNFDLDEEMKFRTPDKPYVITHDEFYEAELDYDTITLTYFETDDTLVNEKDEPIPNIDEMVGDDHLVRFGHGSKDKNIVYVRNEKLQSDFEIIRSSGSYLEEVLGMPDEGEKSLKHSDQRDRRRAFRHGDG